MEIQQILENKWGFLPLLLVGDEQADLIARYLDRADLFALYEAGALRAVCAVTAEGGGDFELKNLAVDPAFHRRGYGAALVAFIADRCRRLGGRRLLAGTGDSPLTLPFYRACGFRESHRIPNFFTDHYDHPIFEAGRQLTDMIYLALDLGQPTDKEGLPCTIIK